MWSPAAPSPHLGWSNVCIGSIFVLTDVLVSSVFQLGIASSLLVASIRCVVQLTIMGLYLEKVFASDSFWGVSGVIVLLNVLGAIEVTYNKAKGRYRYMFPKVLVSMLASTVPISILGSQFAMAQPRFWQPDQFSMPIRLKSGLVPSTPESLLTEEVPIIGMILGNAISSVGVGWNTVQKEFIENRDKVETYLALGASRSEACMPVARGALKVALLPVVNQLSVIGLISIPGMMTGAIIGGKPVDQAARLQMIIMFMIAASSTLAVLFSLFFACSTVVDGCSRLRPDFIDMRKPALYRWRDSVAGKLWRGLRRLTRRKAGGDEGERRGLLAAG